MDVPLTPSMMDIIAEIMVKLLPCWPLLPSKLNKVDSVSETSSSLVHNTSSSVWFRKIAKKLLGESEIESVLQRLDHLTLEEGWMAIAQILEVVQGLVNNVKVVMNGE